LVESLDIQAPSGQGDMHDRLENVKVVEDLIFIIKKTMAYNLKDISRFPFDICYVVDRTLVLGCNTIALKGKIHFEIEDDIYFNDNYFNLFMGKVKIMTPIEMLKYNIPSYQRFFAIKHVGITSLEYLED
jgi:hypothetical protein